MHPATPDAPAPRAHARALALAAVALATLAPPTSTRAGTLLYSPLDSLDGWEIRALGETRARPLHAPGQIACTELHAARGTILLTRSLPGHAIAARTLSVQCKMRAFDLVRGPQPASTAKLHLAVETPTGTLHFSSRAAALAEWEALALEATVPADARRAILNLGLEACSGTIHVAQLVARDNLRALHPLDLSAATNARHDQIGLPSFPTTSVRVEDVVFPIPNTAEKGGPDCIRLRGRGHEDWPGEIVAQIPVGRSATTILILHAAIGGRPRAESPCAIWTAHLANGHRANLSVFEGRDIGAVGQTDDLPNWRVAWRDTAPDGRACSLGITRWPIHESSPILALTARAYNGAPQVILGIVAVEDPPPPPRPATGDDEAESEEEEQ